MLKKSLTLANPRAIGSLYVKSRPEVTTKICIINGQHLLERYFEKNIRTADTIPSQLFTVPISSYDQQIMLALLL